METTTIIGSLAALLTTIANLPQAYKIVKEKTTEGVSAITYAILFTGTALWTIYGIIDTDWPIIVSNAISALISLTILVLKIIPDSKIKALTKTSGKEM